MLLGYNVEEWRGGPPPGRFHWRYRAPPGAFGPPADQLTQVAPPLGNCGQILLPLTLPWSPLSLGIDELNLAMSPEEQIGIPGASMTAVALPLEQ